MSDTLAAMFGLPSPKPAAKGAGPVTPVGLLEEEYTPHFQAWRAEPSGANAGKLLQAVDPVIKSALRTYAGAGQSSPTMRSKAKLVVLDSLPRYDPNKAKLRTYLMTSLQSLRRAQAEESQIVSVPERVRLDQQLLRTATAELTDKLGREPSDGELAEHAGVSLKRLAHVRQAKGSLAEGQMVNTTEDPGGSADVAVAPRGRETYLRFIYGDLSPTDQFIMERSLGLHGHSILPKGEIARKLGISAGAVSQRAAKIQAILDKHENMRISVL